MKKAIIRDDGKIMRISADPNHEWFHPDCVDAVVYLDGKLLPDCRQADAIEGVAWCFAPTEWYDEKTQEINLIQYNGVVEIRRKEKV